MPLADPSRVPDRVERVGSANRTYWTGRTNEESDEDLIFPLVNRHAGARRPELLRRLAAEAGITVDTTTEES